MTATAAPVCVDVEQLRYGYRGGEFHLAVPRLRVERGEKVVFIGPSGSGKSTLLNLIAGILVADAGRVELSGHAWGEMSDAARRRLRIANVGLVFQEFELLDHLSVRENILLPYFVQSALQLTGDVKRRVDELAQATGIAPLLRRHPRELSQGERQRVAICRAMITSPELILADEPTGNLDPETSHRVLDLLLAETVRAEATLIVVTHDHELVDRFDRVVDFRTF